MKRNHLLCILLSIVVSYLLYTAISPYDRLTWLLEVFPVLIAVPMLILTRNQYPLTPLLYTLIFIHCLILITGGEYTYARVPLGYWLQDLFGLARNPYDRIGHFAQGFVPAIIAREILTRGRYVAGRKMQAFLVVCVCLAISAAYELIEWISALVLGQGADEFLGTQGDVWDTQWDMFMALVGAVVALASLSKYHDRQIEVLERKTIEESGMAGTGNSTGR